MGAFVETPKASRFGGLVLPETVLATMIRQEVRSSWTSTRRDNKNTINWDVSAGSADADLLPYAADLRYQSRDLYRNNPLAGGALNTMNTSVVGTGLRPQASIDRELLGLTADQASAWQRSAERYFFMWADSENADIRRTLNFWQLQDLVSRSEMLSGDCFTFRRFKERKGWPFGTALQVVEADRCATPPGKGADSRVRDGVESDEDGAPVRYHFMQNHPGDLLRDFKKVGKWTSTPAFDDFGMRLTLHHYAVDRPESSRGAPYLAPVIETIKQLGRYTEAEVTAAVVSGMFSVFVKSEMPSGPAGLLPGGIPGQVGGVQVTPPGTGLTRLQSGAIVDLAPGEDVTFANPNRPNTAFDPFVMAVLRQVGARLELPFEILVKHFTSSYSASRAALLEAWKVFKRRRAWLVASLNKHVWEWVIAECVARGFIKAPGFFDDPIKRQAWLGCTWTGSPMGQLDPMKEANAAEKWLDLNAVTLQQVTAEHFGRDYEDNLPQIAREREQQAALPPSPRAPAPAPAAPDAPADEDEQKSGNVPDEE